MGRIAGVPNKLTSEVKEKLQILVEGVVDTLDITEKTQLRNLSRVPPIGVGTVGHKLQKLQKPPFNFEGGDLYNFFKVLSQLWYQ